MIRSIRVAFCRQAFVVSFKPYWDAFLSEEIRRSQEVMHLIQFSRHSMSCAWAELLLFDNGPSVMQCNLWISGGISLPRRHIKKLSSESLLLPSPIFIIELVFNEVCVHFYFNLVYKILLKLLCFILIQIYCDVFTFTRIEANWCKTDPVIDEHDFTLQCFPISFALKQDDMWKIQL